MTTTKTVNCTKCDWTTDLNTMSDTNPNHCPECGNDIVVSNVYYNTINELSDGDIVTDGLDNWAVVKKCVHGNQYYAHRDPVEINPDTGDFDIAVKYVSDIEMDHLSNCCN